MYLYISVWHAKIAFCSLQPNFVSLESFFFIKAWWWGLCICVMYYCLCLILISLCAHTQHTFHSLCILYFWLGHKRTGPVLVSDSTVWPDFTRWLGTVCEEPQWSPIYLSHIQNTKYKTAQFYFPIRNDHESISLSADFVLNQKIGLIQIPWTFQNTPQGGLIEFDIISQNMI